MGFVGPTAVECDAATGVLVEMDLDLGPREGSQQVFSFPTSLVPLPVQPVAPVQVYTGTPEDWDFDTYEDMGHPPPPAEGEGRKRSCLIDPDGPSIARGKKARIQELQSAVVKAGRGGKRRSAPPVPADQAVACRRLPRPALPEPWGLRYRDSPCHAPSRRYWPLGSPLCAMFRGRCVRHCNRR